LTCTDWPTTPLAAGFGRPMISDAGRAGRRRLALGNQRSGWAATLRALNPYPLTHATMSWSASVPSKRFKFQSAAAHTSRQTFAELVNERNGSFSASEEDD